MPVPSQPPLEARVLPDPPSARGGAGQTWLLASGAFLGFVLCFAVALWGLGRLLVRHNQRDSTPRGSLIKHWESSEERLAAVKAALESKDRGATSAEIRELTRLFARVASSVNPDLPFTANKLLDLDALADRIVQHPLLKQRGIDRARLRRQLEYDIKSLPQWSRIAVVHVTRPAVANEALVYTIATGPNDVPAPVRWWLRRQGRTWRICDWERIDVGYSEAARRALALLASGGSPSSTLHKALGFITGAQSGPLADFGPGSVQQLNAAQALEVPAAAYDLVQTELAGAWQKCARPDQVLAACERVKNPHSHPGTHYLRALAFADRQQHAAVAQAAEEYRRALGPHPHLLEIQAEALEALAQEDDAARCWSDRLRLLPEDQAALIEFCRLLGDDGHGRVVQVLEDTSRPLDFAMRVAAEAIERYDDVTLAAMERFIRDKASERAPLELLAGMRQEQRGDYLRGADHYSAAARQAAHATDQQQHWRLFLHAMAKAGRATQGYLQVPDAAGAFDYLTHGFPTAESPISPADLPPLLAAHHRRLPHDPSLGFYDAILAMEHGDYAAADQALEVAAAAVSDDALHERIRRKQWESLYRQGRLTEAYRRFSKSDHQLAFRELAAHSQRHHDVAALGELIAMHRQAHPADPWTDYFDAVREHARGNLAAALDAIRHTDPEADDALRQLLVPLRDRLSIQLEGVASAYRNSADLRDAYRRLVTLLADGEDWKGVLELTALHSPPGGLSRSTTLYWKAKAHYSLGQYKAAIDTLTPWPATRLIRLSGEQLTELCDLMVRSALRLGDIKSALEAAERARDEYGFELPQVAVALARANQEELRTLLEQRRVARALFRRQLHYDPDLVPLLNDPLLADIRRWHGVAWPNAEEATRLSAVLFFAEPPPQERLASLVQNIASSNGAAETITVQGQRSWLWKLDRARLVVTAVESSYCGCDAIANALRPSDPLQGVLQRHGAWIAIDLFEPDRPDPQTEARRAAEQAIASVALLDRPRPEAIYISGQDWKGDQFAILDATALQQLASGQFFHAMTGGLTPPARHAALRPTPPPDHNAPPVTQRLSRLRRLADHARIERPEGHVLVRARLTRGHAAEDVWLKVIRSTRSSGGQRASHDSDEDAFFAEMTHDSRLWPFLRTGERVHMDYHQPLEVRPLDSSSPPGRGPG